MPLSCEDRCPRCSDTGVIGTALWSTVAELRELVAAGDVKVCDCEEGQTIRRLLREEKT